MIPDAPGQAPRQRRPLMLVSARISQSARTEAAEGQRPWSEYLTLERDHDVNLLDWSLLRSRPTRRSGRAAVAHAVAGMRHVRSVPALLTDGEHVGLPLAAALALTPRRPRHVMIAHHLNTRAKERFLALPRVAGSIDSFVVHSRSQVDALTGTLGLPEERVHLVRYGVDTTFWAPTDDAVSRLIVSPGREHRDHATLAEAVAGLDAHVFVTDGSSHSPAARRRVPTTWPANIERGSLPLDGLRGLYRRAAVVVVPLVETDFPAGITVVAEAMSMGKAVVVTGTTGLQGAVADPGALITVPAGEPEPMRSAIQQLLDAPDRRAELGARARMAAVQHHDVRRLAAELAHLLLPTGGTHG
ncbi:MAG: glycosyltransferase family 4 protein [Propionicimonas sp.]